MIAARIPREDALGARVLTVDPRAHTVGERTVPQLVELLTERDLLVVNDAATVPASLRARAQAVSYEFEVRLAGAPHPDDEALLDAVLFGPGDWRTPTEHRAPAPPLARGDLLTFHRAGVSHAFAATVHAVDATSPRLLTLRFDRTHAPLYRALYALGVPVQYSHLARPLAVWDVQTAYGARPWAVEAPSAGLPLRFRVLDALRARGVRVAAITHAAGLSSTGDPALDARLPLPERFDVQAATGALVCETRARGGRVVAVGTSTARALEGALRVVRSLDALALGVQGVTDLRLGAHTPRAVVDGLFTGLHEPTASHYALLQSFVPKGLLDRAYAHAEARGFLAHEFGDASLVLAA